MDIKELEKLNEYREKGVITQEEFNAKKQELLNPVKKSAFSWGNCFLALAFGIIYYNLADALLPSDIDIVPVMICNFLFSVIFAFYAHHLQTSNYKNYSGVLGVLIGVTIFGALGVWIITYEFLQILEGNAILKDEKSPKKSPSTQNSLSKIESLMPNKFSRKWVICSVIALSIVLVSLGIYSHKPQENYEGPEECELAIKRKHYTSQCYIKGKNGYTPLMFAILNKESSKVIQKIIDNGANVNNTLPCENDDSEDACLSILDIAAKYVNEPKVIEKIIEAGVALRDVTETGLTLADNATLYAAEHNENIDILKLFLQQGVDVNLVSEGYNLLMAASGSNQNPKIVEFLLEKGLDVNARDAEEATALIYAARQNKNPEIVGVLLDHGADVLASDIDGKTALDYAKDNSNLQSSKIYKRLSDLTYEKRIQENKKLQQEETARSLEKEQDGIIGTLVPLN